MAFEGLDPDDKNEFRKREPQPVPPGRKGQWLAVSNHNHSTYWDGKKPLTVLQQEAYLRNLDAMGAKAIGIDILFDQPQDEDDQLIAISPARRRTCARTSPRARPASHCDSC